jgi:hypothetical protein
MPLVYRGRALGILCAFDRLEGPAEFDQDDEQALRAFAASAATAVATAKTVEGDRLRAAIDSAEAERRRWARELHDETLQSLGGLKVLLSAAARADEPDRLRTAVRDAAEQVSGGSTTSGAHHRAAARLARGARTRPRAGDARATNAVGGRAGGDGDHRRAERGRRAARAGAGDGGLSRRPRRR